MTLFAAATLAAFVPLSAAHAQTGVISGRVTDGSSLQPLNGAQVYVVSTARGVLTGTDGRYRLSVPPGTYTVRAQYLGYETGEQSVTVTAGETATVDFALSAGGLIVDELVITGARTQRSAIETTVPVDVITSL